MSMTAARYSLWFPLALILSFALRVEAQTITIAPDGGGKTYVVEGDLWSYFKGTADPSDPADAWAELDFDDDAWEVGPSGFGYDDGDDATVLNDMEDSYRTVYIRHEFNVGAVPEGDLVLSVDYDDGFIAYINGAEVHRENMPGGAVDRDTSASSNHEAGSFEHFVLGPASDFLVAGSNVIAIEGHNVNLGSSDFSLIPELRVGGSVSFARDGNAWIVATETLKLVGETPVAAAASVRVAGVPATFDDATGGFEVDVTLDSGRNSLLAEALDSEGAVVDTGAIEIIYLPESSRAGGTLDEDTTWAGALLVEESVTVPANISLNVDPGATIFLREGVSIFVSGELRALGTEESPIRFTHFGEDTTWDRIIFREAADSRFDHCTFEYADCEGEHQDYYEPGDRDYREAIVVLASHVDFNSCLFQNLPNDSGSQEGDAMAIISDDPDTPGPATANVINCQFIGIGQGVHTRFAYVRVEGCYFTGHHGDNDDVDLWGESDPPPLIINNLFEYPEDDDAINPTKCSAILIGNIIRGTNDHGIVLRGKCSPIMINNVVSDCSSGGIAIENTCDALLINNVVYDCGRGLRLFDLGRAGPPYRLEPGGGYATVINCIIWNCDSPITLADSSNPDAEDQGSHLTLIHSIVEDGEDGISVSGSDSTVTWGEGNLSVDPLFVDPDNGDFRLQAGSPAIDAGTSEQAPDDDLDGRARPCGDAVDIGPYESGPCEGGPQRFVRGEINGDGRMDVSDAIALLLHLFAGGAEPSCLKAADADDSGTVNITDATRVLSALFQAGDPPSAPFPSCGVDLTDDDLTCEEFAACS